MTAIVPPTAHLTRMGLCGASPGVMVASPVPVRVTALALPAVDGFNAIAYCGCPPRAVNAQTSARLPTSRRAGMDDGSPTEITVFGVTAGDMAKCTIVRASCGPDVRTCPPLSWIVQV